MIAPAQSIKPFEHNMVDTGTLYFLKFPKRNLGKKITGIHIQNILFRLTRGRILSLSLIGLELKPDFNGASP